MEVTTFSTSNIEEERLGNTLKTEKKRVTFTDFIGTLMAFPAWLMPTIITVAYLYPNVDSLKLFIFAALIFVGQNIQHHFHRFMGKSTFKAINREHEKSMLIFFILFSLPFLAIISYLDALSLLLSGACLFICFAYTIIEPFKEYLWGFLGFFCEFVTAYRFLSFNFPPLSLIALHSGIWLLVASWIVGYRIMTADYGPVPVCQTKVFQHLLALTVGLLLLALGILWL